MVFTAPIFIFLFLPLLLVFYYLFKRSRNITLLLFSIGFLAWGEPLFVFVVLASAFIDWVCGKYIYTYRESAPLKSKLFLGLAAAQNLGILIFYKYTNFIFNNLNSLLTDLHIDPVIIPSILLPIGVSFIVFEKITYVVDVFRKEGAPSKSFMDYLLYVFLFPKLLAGPIIKYHDIATQLKIRTHGYESIMLGITRFSFGFAKKVFIADSMGEIADQVFSLGAGHVGFFNSWLGILCYSIQLYFDFSGYSDMAIGLARIFGFRLMENFNNPYIAKNFTDFWRRWHISLSSWIKSYVYIPLGGNRVSQFRMYLNLWLCFLLSGIWHGASWTFVLWGAYQGVFMVIDKLGWAQLQKKLPAPVNILITFFLTLCGWVIFRSENIQHMFMFFRSMFDPLQLHGDLVYVTANTPFFLFLGLLLSFIPAMKQYDTFTQYLAQDHTIRERMFYISIILFVLAVCKTSAMSFNPFLYFRF